MIDALEKMRGAHADAVLVERVLLDVRAETMGFHPPEAVTRERLVDALAALERLARRLAEAPRGR